MRERALRWNSIFFSAQLPQHTENESKFFVTNDKSRTSLRKQTTHFCWFDTCFHFIRVVPFCFMSSLHSDYAHFSRSWLSNDLVFLLLFKLNALFRFVTTTDSNPISDVECQVWVCDQWIAFTSIVCGVFYLQFNEINSLTFPNA